MTFREWITGLRLEYAKNILKEHPEINIQKLAESSGFLSRSNFIKSFTKIRIYKFTASEWLEVYEPRLEQRLRLLL